MTDYLLVAQDEIHIERFTRQPDETWLFTEFVGAEASVDLPAIGCVLRLSDVFEKVALA